MLRFLGFFSFLIVHDRKWRMLFPVRAANLQGSLQILTGTVVAQIAFVEVTS